MIAKHLGMLSTIFFWRDTKTVLKNCYIQKRTEIKKSEEE